MTYVVWQTSIAHLATQSKTSSQCKGIEAQIDNLERNTTSQIYHAMTLPVTQPPTSGKQLIGPHSANQNPELLYNIHFPLNDNSIAGPSLLPSGSYNLGQTQTLNSQQKNIKIYAGDCHKTCCKEMLEV